MHESRLKKLDKSSLYYPKEWQELNDAPTELQYIGDITLLQSRKFTVVGSRTTPVQARKIGKEIVGGLTEAFTIVTGVADGGDEAAIQGALSAGGKVICLLAGGFSSIPQSNLPLLEEVAKTGLILSPHPFDTPTRSFSYEYRNKLLAYLGECTLVLGAGEKSGALITAKYAKKAGKKLFALPYPPCTHAGAGCNALIKEGAYLTETANDVFEKTGVEIAVKQPIEPLNETETAVYTLLKEEAEAHINELSVKSGLPVFKLRAVLSALEVKGLAVSLGGNRYAPAR